METAEQRLVKTKKFVDELLNKERFYNWTAFDVLMAVKGCIMKGTTELPKEKRLNND